MNRLQTILRRWLGIDRDVITLTVELGATKGELKLAAEQINKLAAIVHHQNQTLARWAAESATLNAIERKHKGQGSKILTLGA